MMLNCIKKGGVSMYYGVISDAMTQTELTVMKAKKISVKNIYCVSKCGLLEERLEIGDKVTIVGIEIFDSILQFVSFAKMIATYGANLQIIEQPYLQLRNGKYWKSAIVKDVDYRMALESRMLNATTHKGINMDRNTKIILANNFAKLNLHIMAKTYSADGILKRNV